MKQLARLKIIFLIFGLLLSLLCEVCEAKGKSSSGRGGGIRIGGSRGGSKSSGGWLSGKGGSGSVLNGRTVVGTYKSFGSPNRWSLRGGRSFYFVGYPYGHHHYGHNQYYGNSYREDNEPLNPWIIMILVLIGINVAGLLVWAIVYSVYK